MDQPKMGNAVGILGKLIRGLLTQLVVLETVTRQQKNFWYTIMPLLFSSGDAHHGEEL